MKTLLSSTEISSATMGWVQNPQEGLAWILSGEVGSSDDAVWPGIQRTGLKMANKYQQEDFFPSTPGTASNSDKRLLLLEHR